MDLKEKKLIAKKLEAMKWEWKRECWKWGTGLLDLAFYTSRVKPKQFCVGNIKLK
jgi:hypothetical protein